MKSGEANTKVVSRLMYRLLPIQVLLAMVGAVSFPVISPATIPA